MTELRVRFTSHFWVFIPEGSEVVLDFTSLLEEQLHWGLTATPSSFQQLTVQLEPELHLLN